MGRRAWVQVAVLAGFAAIYTFSVNGGIINGNGAADVAAGYGPPYFAALWVLRDTQRTRFHPAYHYGLFLWLAWFVLVPHYLIRTRGWRGAGLAMAASLVLWAPLVAALLGWWFYEDLPDFR